VRDGHAAVIRGAPGKFYPRDGSPAFRLLRPQESPRGCPHRRPNLELRDDLAADLRGPPALLDDR
jgi:hypothetical protein